MAAPENRGSAEQLAPVAVHRRARIGTDPPSHGHLGSEGLRSPLATSTTTSSAIAAAAAASEARKAAAPAPPMTVSSEAPPPPAPLLEEVDRLVRRHQVELNQCLQKWLQHQQDVHGGVLTGVEVREPKARQGGASREPQAEPTCSSPMRSSPRTSIEQFLAQPRAPGTVDDPVFLNSVVPTDLPTRLSSWASMPNTNGVKRETSPHSMSTAEVLKKRKNRVRRQRRSRELIHRRSASLIIQPTRLQRITGSRFYEIFSGALILLNCVFIGIQTQYLALEAERYATRNLPQRLSLPPVFLVLQVLFCFAFMVELGLRWACDGFLQFFQDSDRWWNVADVVIVFLSIVDVGASLVLGNEVPQSISGLRVIRVLRVVRVARLIRIMTFFRELRMMVFSILGSARSLMWVIVVLGITFFIFGVTFTAAATTHLDTPELWSSESSAGLRQHFGTVGRSVLSLFMAMSGGNDWGLYFDALQVLHVGYQGLFIIFILFAIFAVVNIVTGVFVDSAMKSSLTDREVIVHEELTSKHKYLHSMREVFEEMDADGTGNITLEEFEKRLDDERVIAYFNALKLDVSDARTLFVLLDYDQSDEINIDEFLTGCYRLQGESRSLDMKIMQYEVRFLQEAFATFSTMMREVHAFVTRSDPDEECALFLGEAWPPPEEMPVWQEC